VGEPPFHGRPTLETLLAHAQEPPPPLRPDRDDVPAEVEALLLRMLAKDPKARPQSAAEVAAALLPFAGSATAKLAGQPKPSSRSFFSGALAACVVAGLLLTSVVVLIGLWASGVIHVRTPDGVLVVEVTEANPDIFVDGQQVTVAWDAGGKSAQIHVKPGTR